MRIVPRYEGPTILTIAGGGDVSEPLVRQRRRLEAIFASLADDGWRAPTRCENWRVQDVATHLDGVNGFFHSSIAAGLAGTPTRVLEGFDPKASPAAMVDAVSAKAPADTLTELVESNDALCELVASLDDQQWSTIAEGPPGLVPIRLLVHHALWDSWVHERDVGLPLGLAVAEEPDEVLACLRYVAGFGSAVALTLGKARPALMVLETTDPDGCVAVEVTDRVVVHDQPLPDATVVLRDSAVSFVEALSVRGPLTGAVPADHRWLVDTLAVVFETA
ncbi:MAG: maleylpyruvate isomerase family mycothiol-dependent enzyme [Acidimicrobiales bacterium]